MPKIHLFASANIFKGSVDEEIYNELQRLGFKVDYVRHTKILQGMVKLPFIETEKGERFYGLLAIGEFIGKHKVIKNLVAAVN